MNLPPTIPTLPPPLPRASQLGLLAGDRFDFFLLRNVFVCVLKRCLKEVTPSTACPPGIVPAEKRPPEPPGPPPPPGDASQELNPAVTAALLQLLSQPDPEPPDYGRTYSSEGELNALLEPSAQASGKSRTFMGSVSHLGESSAFQGSLQFPGDQDLRFARAPPGSHNNNNNILLHPEAKLQSYSELGPGAAASSGAGTGHSWGAPTQAPPSYGKAFRGPGRVPPRGGRGRGVPY